MPSVYTSRGQAYRANMLCIAGSVVGDRDRNGPGAKEDHSRNMGWRQPSPQRSTSTLHAARIPGISYDQGHTHVRHGDRSHLASTPPQEGRTSAWRTQYVRLTMQCGSTIVLASHNPDPVIQGVMNMPSPTATARWHTRPQSRSSRLLKLFSPS